MVRAQPPRVRSVCSLSSCALIRVALPLLLLALPLPIGTGAPFPLAPNFGARGAPWRVLVAPKRAKVFPSHSLPPLPPQGQTGGGSREGPQPHRVLAAGDRGVPEREADLLPELWSLPGGGRQDGAGGTRKGGDGVPWAARGRLKGPRVGRVQGPKTGLLRAAGWSGKSGTQPGALGGLWRSSQGPGRGHAGLGPAHLPNTGRGAQASAHLPGQSDDEAGSKLPGASRELPGNFNPKGSVARNVRALLQGLRLAPLGPQEREALVAPCSWAWRRSVGEFFKNQTALRKPWRKVQGNIREVCLRLRAMVDSLVQAGGCGFLAAPKGPGLQSPLALQSQGVASGNSFALNLSRADEERILQARGQALGASSTRDPAECEWDAALLRVGVPPQPEQQPYSWGDCWPAHLPMSPGLQASSLPGAKFLVAAFMNEQLSGAKIHLAEAARLAKHSNRILVVPPGSNSRMLLGHPDGAPPCGPGRSLLPACEYLDMARMGTGTRPAPQWAEFAGPDWVSWDLFMLLQAKFLRKKPKVGFLCLMSRGQVPCLAHKEVVANLELILALAQGSLPTLSNMHTFNTEWQPELGAGDVLGVLKGRWADAEVVVHMKVTASVLNFGPVRLDSYTEALMRYPQALQEKAEELAQSLGPKFVALHFRSEFIVWRMKDRQRGEIKQRMLRCAASAAKLVQDTLKAHKDPSRQGQGHNNTKVFIAADIPFNGSVSRSGSWIQQIMRFGRRNSLQHAHSALRSLRSSIPNTVMLDELEPQVNELDPGVASLLDKLVAARADAFLAGKLECGGLRNFEVDILRQRRYLGKSTDVLRWGAW